MYDAYIKPYFGRFISSLRNWKLFPKFMTKRLMLLNIIRCELHHEVVLGILKNDLSQYTKPNSAIVPDNGQEDIH